MSKSLRLLLLFTIIIFYTSCTVSKNKKSTTPKMITFEKQLSHFKEMGYSLKPGVDKEFILDFVQKELQIEKPKDEIEKFPYSILYFALSQQDSKIEGYYLTNQYFWYVLDYFEQPIAYTFFMKRMGLISDGEINFKDISIDFDENNIKWISFNVNGISKKWNLGKGDYVDDSFVQRFSYLTEELNTIGKYTYYDKGGEDFIIDYATEKEQTHFNKITGLNRIWLGEGNHFAEPTK